MKARKKTFKTKRKVCWEKKTARWWKNWFFKKTNRNFHKKKLPHKLRHATALYEKRSFTSKN